MESLFACGRKLEEHRAADLRKERVRDSTRGEIPALCRHFALDCRLIAVVVKGVDGVHALDCPNQRYVSSPRTGEAANSMTSRQ